MNVAKAKLDSWDDFREKLSGYLKLPYERQRQFIFRGQANADWALNTTLERFVEKNPHVGDPRQCSERLLEEFRRAAVGLGVDVSSYGKEIGIRLFARHHGLPMPVLDWTESPFVAAFFAFDSEESNNSDFVSIWTFDRVKLATDRRTGIEIVDDEDFITWNQRAIEQRSVFLVVEPGELSITDHLMQSGLYRFDIPARDRHRALRELDEMMINPRNMFRDLDSAARLAMRRLSRGGQ